MEQEEEEQVSPNGARAVLIEEESLRRQLEAALEGKAQHARQWRGVEESIAPVLRRDPPRAAKQAASQRLRHDVVGSFMALSLYVVVRSQLHSHRGYIDDSRASAHAGSQTERGVRRKRECKPRQHEGTFR